MKVKGDMNITFQRQLCYMWVIGYRMTQSSQKKKKKNLLKIQIFTQKAKYFHIFRVNYSVMREGQLLCINLKYIGNGYWGVEYLCYFSFQKASTLTLPLFREDIINNLGNQTSLMVVREA